MTPLQANAPKTVLDLLFAPDEDNSVAVIPGLLPPGVGEDLDRALRNVPATLREAAVRETTGAARDLLNANPIGFLVSGWQKHREVIAAARRTMAAPGSIELVDLATHQITVTQRPAVNLLVDNRQTATVELGLSVVFTVGALVAGISGGRLVAVHSGRCNVTANLAVQDTQVISRQVAFELPGIIPLGQGIALLADHGYSASAGEETSQASVA
jgi:hypothetical protein